MEDDAAWRQKQEAPEGAIWVCGACGKTKKNRVDFSDEACFLNAVLCKEQSMTPSGNGPKWEVWES